jgi:polyisoprenoid-binding protein YceI
MKAFALGALAALSLTHAALAGAADWRAQPGSTLGVRGALQGEAVNARFARFTPVIRFDPAQLAGARFDVAIDLASVGTNNAEYDDGLKSTQFFNVKKQPQARYVATKFRALGKGRFVAEGVLTLNGASRPVPLTFTWSGGAKPVLAGSATVKRLDFGVGTGDWADLDVLPNEVQVNTRLLLAPVR